MQSLDTDNKVEGEYEGEYNFNHSIRTGSAPLVRTMSIPIPTEQCERKTWCSVTMCLYLSKSKNLHVYSVWNKLMAHVQDRLGYVRSGARTSTNQATITITTTIDIFDENITVYELQSSLEKLTQCRIHIDHVITSN